tara:strand:- start:2738 stop:2992 length:255 start_codon:yes stop_codon:yes gene_type:complete
MNESTALIKLTKSEIEWAIIALVFSEQSAEHFQKWDEAKMYKRIRKDFVKIKEDIIKGEKELETRNEKEKANRNSPQACKSCDD